MEGFSLGDDSSNSIKWFSYNGIKPHKRPLSSAIEFLWGKRARPRSSLCTGRAIENSVQLYVGNKPWAVASALCWYYAVPDTTVRPDLQALGNNCNSTKT